MSRFVTIQKAADDTEAGEKIINFYSAFNDDKNWVHAVRRANTHGQVLSRMQKSKSEIKKYHGVH
jgi:hypothetical protein